MNSFVNHALFILCLTHWAFESSAEHNDQGIDSHDLPRPLTSRDSERIYGKFKTQTSRRRRDLREVTVQNKALHYHTVEGYWSLNMSEKLWVHAGQVTFGQYIVHWWDHHIARVILRDEIIPAVFMTGQPQRECVYTNDQKKVDCWKIVLKNELEFLGWSRFYEWVPRYNGDICNGAVVGGMTKFFEKTYICRIHYRDAANRINATGALGKLEPRTGQCETPTWDRYIDHVISRKNYQVLRDKRYSDISIDKRFDDNY